jgi:hypothetical protein
MHVKQLKTFLDYTPVFTDTPQHIVDDIVVLAQKYIAEKDIPRIQQAYEFAKNAHQT